MDLPDTEDQLFQLDQYPILETEQTTKNIGGYEILIELLENLVNKELQRRSSPTYFAINAIITNVVTDC